MFDSAAFSVDAFDEQSFAFVAGVTPETPATPEPRSFMSVVYPQSKPVPLVLPARQGDDEEVLLHLLH